MLTARSPLSVKNEQTLSGQLDKMSLDKENTVRLLQVPAHRGRRFSNVTDQSQVLIKSCCVC